jgi:glycosyltransferase involved in cell wall biosynthesis
LNDYARVSVVVPVHDGEPYIAEAIDSILGQTRPADELIVVDDGSADATPEVLAGYGERLRVIRQENRGVASALNRGIGAASGEYVAFLDADDVWTADKLAVQLEVFERESDVEAVFGLVEQFLAEDADPELARTVAIPPAPQAGIVKTAMLIRGEALDRIGGFDESRFNSDFTDWYVRAVEHGLTTRVPQALVARRRIHGANIGIRHQDRQWSETLEVLKASLDRRRS